MGGVIIDPNIRATRVRLDLNGNEIDPITKQIIRPVEQPFVPTREEIEAQINAVPVEGLKMPASTLSIKEQIIEAEAHLADLKVRRKLEIEKMKAELAELEQDE